MVLVPLLGICTASAFAQDVSKSAVLEVTDGYLPVSHYVRWAVDTEQTWEPEQAARELEDQPLYTGDNDWLELGMMDEVVWLAISIQNGTSDERLLLEFRNPRMSFVDAYIPDGEGGYTLYKSGAARKFRVRPIDYPMPAFPFELAPGETTELLLRLKNNGDFRQRIWLWTERAFIDQLANSYRPEVATVGLLVLLFIFQFMTFLILRERTYLFLCLFVISWLMFMLAATGLGKQVLWPEFRWLSMRANSVFTVCMMTTFLLFTASYLESQRLMPRLHKLTMAWVGVCLVFLAYVCLSDTLLRMHLNGYVVLVSILTILALVLRAVYLGSKPARFFFISWAFMLGGGSMLLFIHWYGVGMRWPFRRRGSCKPRSQKGPGPRMPCGETINISSIACTNARANSKTRWARSGH